MKRAEKRRENAKEVIISPSSLRVSPRDVTHVDERTVHRLEAFSDIVIAFSLTEAGIGLTIPKDTAGLVSALPNLYTFAFSFSLICVLWWYHHKLFVTFLVLNGATLVMNFVLLGFLALGIYFQQVTGHFLAGGVNAAVPLHLWLVCLGTIYALLAAMYAVGISGRRGVVDVDTLRWGIRLTYETGVSALGLLGLSIAFPAHLRASFAIVVIVGVAAALRDRIASRLTRRLRPSAESTGEKE